MDNSTWEKNMIFFQKACHTWKKLGKTWEKHDFYQNKQEQNWTHAIKKLNK